MLVSVQKVRIAKALTTTAVWETGDGKGTENAVDCQGGNKLLVLWEASRPDVQVTGFYLKVEYSSGADEPYADTTLDAAVRKIELKVATHLPAAGNRGPYAVVLPVHGRFARISVKADWSTGAPTMAVCAATISTVSGEGALLGASWVRRAAGIASSSSAIGDGYGGENPVDTRRADWITLSVAGNLATNATLQIYHETSVNGSSWFRTTWYDPAVGNPELYFLTYNLSYLQFGGNGVDGALAVGMEALGAWSRFTFVASGGAVNVSVHG